MKNWRSYLPASIPKEWREIKEGIEGAVFQRTDGLLVYFRASYEHNSRFYLYAKIHREKPKEKLKNSDIDDGKNSFLGEGAVIDKVFLSQIDDEPATAHLWVRIYD